MKAILIRTGSGSVLVPTSLLPGSPRISLSKQNSFSGGKTSPRTSLHLDVNHRSMRRALSESDMINSPSEVSGGIATLTNARSQSYPARILVEEYVSNGEDVVLAGIGSLMLTERGVDQVHYASGWPGSRIPLEELGFSGDGIGKGRISGGGRGGSNFGTSGGSAEPSKIGAYYQEMLKLDPTNSLLLRNYGKFLHEVEGDTVKAEECYGRAILASPGDGEVLSLYGKLIWETQGNQVRAKTYFDRAVHASPDDCMVLGSYAQFMWEAEEDEDEEREVEESPVMIEAF